MKKKVFLGFFVLVLVFIFGSQSCKTSEDSLIRFSIEEATGYSKQIRSQDPDDEGITTINLFVALRNQKKVSGTIISWNFKIKNNIVTLLEINNTNYQDFNLITSGNMIIPAENILEFYVNTPPPAEDNAIATDLLNFINDIPNQVVVEVEIQDDNGEVTTIHGQGGYTFETQITEDSKYNIIGEWRLSRVVDGQNQPTQKIVFVGTRSSGQYVIYNLSSAAAGAVVNEVFENGSFFVSGVTSITMTSSQGTQYWGEFTDEKSADGTLLIPATGTGRGDTPTRTGTWKMKLL